jgi:hypothetical protein
VVARPCGTLLEEVRPYSKGPWPLLAKTSLRRQDPGADPD